ncbi:transcription elongation factor GreA [Cellulosilyticum sp. ST5]|uniref:Transcription elongation factor GreA n=1 Tax=Cellulosilyticum lentocellum (strain ATCC 49066 / DSM 5427 / NCIMB 11756 / RHM5) TaxID=642492 RepID=F2JSJ0_CELLD|nr:MULTISPECIES: transcription elongation factor GreA [Cellulosilyticum]ADZ81770.1 transcription elongation factor GreA [Cellulosilyticum lentocellum DSM 5427]QEH67441.1 transcription elongation factor GreA [Cellulosilyticum sp. WCF-2]
MNNYLTQQDIDNMKKEIEYRKVVVRKQRNEEVKEARAHGDLSENYEYKAAKRERGRNEGRIKYLERMIKTATIITDNTEAGEVGLGKLVDVYFIEDDMNIEYEIVTTMETDAINNKISIESPLGKMIYKKRVGDIVNIDSPDGEYSVRIQSIRKS